MSMPYEIFGIPALICLAFGIYRGLKAMKKES